MRRSRRCVASIWPICCGGFVASYAGARQRYQSRLEWRRPGTVWAADFKERREPLEGRYSWILAVKDLASRCQLAWQPLVEATAEAVQATYTRLFEEHGPPLVLKSDNGGQFKADETKALLAQYAVVPLYSPKRHPQYNGGVERANGQLTGYPGGHAREGSTSYRPARPAPTRKVQLELANELARTRGMRGLDPRLAAAVPGGTKPPLHAPASVSPFLAAVAEHRTEARLPHWNSSRPTSC